MSDDDECQCPTCEIWRQSRADLLRKWALIKPLVRALSRPDDERTTP